MKKRPKKTKKWRHIKTCRITFLLVLPVRAPADSSSSPTTTVATRFRLACLLVSFAASYSLAGIGVCVIKFEINFALRKAAYCDFVTHTGVINTNMTTALWRGPARHTITRLLMNCANGHRCASLDCCTGAAVLSRRNRSLLDRSFLLQGESHQFNCCKSPLVGSGTEGH